MTESKPHPTPESPEIIACDPVSGFAPGIGHYVAQLAETRHELLRHVGNLTPEQLSWHPSDDVESIGTQLLHSAAIEWSWVMQDIFGRPDDEYQSWEEALPIRAGVPQVTGKPLTYFTDHLRRIREEVLEALKALSDADLVRRIPGAEPPPGLEPGSRLYSIDWILFHIVEHEAHHAGQVELMMRLLPPELGSSPAAS